MAPMTKAAAKAAFQRRLILRLPSIPSVRPSRSIAAAGVTRAVVAPEAMTASLQGRARLPIWVRTATPVTKARAFQFAEFGEAGAANSGGSRAGTHLHFRAMLREAQDYAAGRDAFDDESA